MGTKRFYLLSILVWGLIFCNKAVAQNANNARLNNNTQTDRPRIKAAPGTFQIIYSDKNHAEALNTNILYEAEAMRDEKETKYLIINDYTKIMIPPKSVIRSKDFVPLQEFIIAE